MIRILFLLILIGGLALGIAYPLLMQNVSGHAIGSYTVYERTTGFRPLEVALVPEDAPLRVLVDMTSIGSLVVPDSATVLTLTASVDGRTVLADTLTFIREDTRNDSPQSGAVVHRDEAGVIDPVEAGPYTFVVGPGDAEGIEMRKVEVVLRGGVMEADRRAAPIGYVLMVVGFVGFVLSYRRGDSGRNSEPPKPRWGRGAG